LRRNKIVPNQFTFTASSMCPCEFLRSTYILFVDLRCIYFSAKPVASIFYVFEASRYMIRKRIMSKKNIECIRFCFRNRVS
jgi:hypothetical protein